MSLLAEEEEKEKQIEDEANKLCYMTRVIDNIKVKKQNGRLWTTFHDMQLFEYVIKYNFNFYEISNAFQSLCTNDKKYEYSEDAVRLHWSFLHAMRYFNKTPDDAYYQRMKITYDKEEPKTFKNRVEEKEKILSEEEDIKRMKEEFAKMQKEKEENEKKEKEEKEKIEKEKKEKEKIENEEEEDIICTSSKKNDDVENEEKKETKNEEKINENVDKEPKKEEIKKESKLYDENNEPEYIKQLFSKQIPQDVLDKLMKDEKKYNNNADTPSNTEDNKNNQTTEVSSENNTKNDQEINSNLNINKEISRKKQKVINKMSNFEDEDDDDPFPIKSSKQSDSNAGTQPGELNMEHELRNTQSFNDYIESNPELKKQYDQLNNYCNFAVKSINYIINKGAGLNETSESEARNIEEANAKLNELLLEPIMKKTREEGFSLEDWNKRIEEEEHRMNFETTNYDNFMKTIPQDEEKEMKLNKFKEHLFSYAENISTEDLLDKITKIINTTQGNSNNNNNNNQINNENNNNLNNNQNNNNQNNNNNQESLANRIQNFMDNLENNDNVGVEDEKSENTKEQSESIKEESIGHDNGRNTISSIGSSEIGGKYRHVYRGMVYYSDKPNEDDKNRNRNNRNNRNKKDDDEIEEDDDEDEDMERYNQ